MKAPRTFSRILDSGTTVIKPFTLVWSTAALADLRRIYRYVLSESKNTDIADRFVIDLETKMRAVAASGYSGVARDHVAENLRAFPYRQRCFYFRIDGKEMLVVRVLHGRQDLSLEQFKDL